MAIRLRISFFRAAEINSASPNLRHRTPGFRCMQPDPLPAAPMDCVISEFPEKLIMFNAHKIL